MHGRLGRAEADPFASHAPSNQEALPHTQAGRLCSFSKVSKQADFGMISVLPGSHGYSKTNCDPWAMGFV
jgi:hypothetical protein